ncbi:dihydrofolate reductase family protein [Ktedonobacter racemifer]|uniref:Bifunctional deaminase-reductase domain protein n=1 Tax=Ktedonobacter racemifer DSM 44963 TaxID=485913 RepID=D6TSN6_KTERA|nr:dihydrofolate reductase family protein [Ktedonobacter racemifer]EFH83437.1 bifunctional deaminase-reductase domain protein [Ktedonobacter racemifer DSM 44963]
MRKLILQMQMSVDGYVADENGQTDWMVWNWGEEWNWDAELRRYHNDVAASMDCVLLSRKMAQEGFIHYWATVAEKHDNPQSGFARKITEAQKVVFTKTLNMSEWHNTVLAKGDLAEEVNKLKNISGRNIITYGGATFASSLLQAGLVDELHLIINPSILGSGLPIFDKIRGAQRLSLIHSASYKGGIIVSQYKSRP